MKITYKGDYALKTMLDLALSYGKGPVSIGYLAKSEDIPVKFLEQILLDLKRGGFVESRRGKAGGYLLVKHPGKIKLGEIIRFIEGPIEPIACVDKQYRGCINMKACVFRGIWANVAQATSKIVDHITLEDLVKKSKPKNLNLNYQI